MARSFNDATDRIDYPAAWNPTGSAFSFSCWAYLTQGAEDGYLWHIGQDDSNYGMSVWHRGSSGIGTAQFFRHGSSDLYRISSNSQMPSNAWYSYIVTHDGTFTDYTTVHIYVNGAEINYSSNGNGSSEVSYAATNWSIGGRTYDDLRNFGGYLAEMAIWNRVLNAGEIASLAAGFCPRYFARGIKGYWPLQRALLDWYNGSYGTADGTAVVAHPPKIRYPRISRSNYLPEATIAAILGERGIMRGIGRGIGRGL